MTLFAGQWGVVTGGSKGIGRGIVEALHQEGLNLVLAARDAADLDTAAAELRSARPDGPEVLTTVADTSTMSGIASLFGFLAERIPHLNVFVANAGTQRLHDFLDVTEDDWDTINSLNFKGTFFCCQHAARRMLDEDQANRAIIVVSSNRASTIRPESLAYSMTKAGLIRFVRGAASELAPHGVRINALSPGVTATPLSLKGHHAHAYERAAKRVPMGRVGSPEDCGAGAVYLASPAASFVTGTDLVIDGGEALW